MSKRENRESEDYSIHADEAESAESVSENGVGEQENASEAEEQAKTEQSAAEESNDVSELQNRIRELEAEVSDLKDQYLRKQADFENFRKRMRREKEEAVDYANQQLLLDLTTIIDDFERAIKSAEESRDFDSFHDGIVLIEKQLTGLLERKWGLKRFDSEGEEFDPQKHEAVATEDSNEYEDSRVVEDYQKGYFLNDRVLRTAKVKVSVPASGGSKESDSDSSSDDASDTSGGNVDTEA